MKWKLTCVRTCAVKLAACEKLLLQSGHLKMGKVNKNENCPINIYLIYHLIYTDMGVHHYGCEDVFSMYWAVHRFFHKVDINSVLIRIAYNHCYLHPQMLNLMMLWYFYLILFELLQMFVGFAAANIVDYYLSV